MTGTMEVPPRVLGGYQNDRYHGNTTQGIRGVPE